MGNRRTGGGGRRKEQRQRAKERKIKSRIALIEDKLKVKQGFKCKEGA